jgi:aspartyl protease family protein
MDTHVSTVNSEAHPFPRSGWPRLGHVQANVLLSNPELPEKTIETVGLVDNGSTFTVIPRKVSQELGLKPTGRHVEVETAKGAFELEEAYMRLSSDGVSVLTPSLISDEIASVLVGVITLEQLSFKVNPLTGKLEKHRALLF